MKWPWTSKTEVATSAHPNGPRRLPTIVRDTIRNPWFAAGAFGLSAWAYVGMSHTIADYEGPELGYALGIAYEALVIGMAWEGRRRADQALDAGRKIEGHVRWLAGAIVVGVLSGALAAWHGYVVKNEGVFALSRAVAPVLAAVAVHLFFQSAASARNLERKAQIAQDQETAVLDMLDAVRLAQIAPAHERPALIAAVNATVTRVHRSVPAAVTKQVTAPHLDSERTIHAVIREATGLAATWFEAGQPVSDVDDRPSATPAPLMSDGPDTAHEVAGLVEALAGQGDGGAAEVALSLSDWSDTLDGLAGQPEPARPVLTLAAADRPDKITVQVVTAPVVTGHGGDMADASDTTATDPLTAAIEVLADDPGVSGAALARRLTERGWPVSGRTGQRLRGKAAKALAEDLVLVAD